MQRRMLKIKKGDMVQVMSGKDRGKQARVIRTIPQNRTIVLEGLFLTKKHIRPKRQGEKGQMVDVARPIHASKVMLVCSQCAKPVRVGYTGEGKTKVRVCKKCGSALSS